MYKEQPNSGNFLFFFEKEIAGRKKKLCIDATSRLCKYVNDAPINLANCKMKCILDDEGDVHLCLFAKEDIARQDI